MLKKPINVNEYVASVNSIEQSYTIAVVADLHERNYSEILEVLIAIHPDFIFLPGDTLERREEGIQGHTKNEIDTWQKTSIYWKAVCRILKLLGLNRHNDLYAKSGNGISFVRQASFIAPTFMSVGNHEWYFTDEDQKLFKQNDIKVLDNSDYTLYTEYGDLIRIGGLSTRYNMEWLSTFSEKMGCKLLLCHHPEYYQNMIRNSKMDTFDLIISGHAHGGQFRIFGQGFFSPGQGFFPRYTKGLYGKHLVSAGVSNTAFFPRIGNSREICLIRLNGGNNK